MREIKFRAWDSIRKEMISWELFGAMNGMLLNDSKENTMQFTGLKDKNGKEIYEGDILKFDFIEDERTYYGEVVFLECQFTRYLNKHQGDYYVNFFAEGYSECEIIGNIYENPELLNEVPKEKSK